MRRLLANATEPGRLAVVGSASGNHLAEEQGLGRVFGGYLMAAASESWRKFDLVPRGELLDELEREFDLTGEALAERVFRDPRRYRPARVRYLIVAMVSVLEELR